MMNFTMKSKLNAKRSVGAFELTMRGVAGWLLMLAAVGGLTACSSGDSSSASAPQSHNFGLAGDFRNVDTNCITTDTVECTSSEPAEPSDDTNPADYKPLIADVCDGTNSEPAWCDGSYAYTPADNEGARGATVSITSPVVTLADDPVNFAAEVARYENSQEYIGTFIVAGTSGPGARPPVTHGTVQTQLPLIKAAYAYARGATGKNVTITIVDSGIDPTHYEFGKPGPDNAQSQIDPTKTVADPDKLNVRYLDAFGSDYSPTGSNLLHGTAVASVAAGKRSGRAEKSYRYIHGVAFDANIDFLALRLDSLNGGLSLPDGNVPSDLEFATFFSGILSLAVGNIINFSWAPLFDPIHLTPRDDIRDRWARTAAVLAQTGEADANKKIIVWAAGNSGFDSPHTLAGLGVDFPELQSHIIAVVGVDGEGNIHPDSNKCGLAHNFCIAAPGWDVTAAYYNGKQHYAYEVGGTSLAAPMVSGALAVLTELFRNQLSGTELVARLFATADKQGRYANAEIYGQGMLDLDKATKPVGGQVQTGFANDPNAKPLSQTGFALNGGAFGASFAQLDDIQIAGFDELGAPFFMSASAVITPAARDKTPTPDKVSAQLPEGGGELALRIGADNIPQSGYLSASGWMVGYGENPGQFFNLSDKRDNPLRDSVAGAFNFSEGDRSHLAKTDFGFNRIGFGNQDAFVSPYLALAQNGASLGWRHDNGRFGIAVMHGNAQFDQWQNPGGERGLGILMDWTTQTKRGAIAIQAGAVREPESMLGARANDYALQAQTAFAGVNYARAFGQWDALATAYFGTTRADLNNEFWQADGDIKSSAYALGFTRESLRRHNDKLALRITQPLRAERAKAIMNLPIGRTKAGEVIRHDQQVDFAPHGRTIQIEAAYQLPLTTKNTLHTALGIEREPLHDETLDDNWYARVAFVKGF